MSRLMLLSALLLGLVSSGCTTINKSQRSGSIDIMLQADMNANVTVDMNRKLKGTATEMRILGIPFKTSKYYADGVSYNGGGGGFFGFDGLAGLAKSAAAYKAVRSQKDVDVLVAPQYVIKKTSLFPFYTKVTATVTGYAGKIRSIKNMPQKQVILK